MELIPINTSTATFKEQINFLIKRELYISYYSYKTKFYFLIFVTIIVGSILFFSSANDFVVFKAMSLIFLSICWIIALFIFIPFLLKRRKRIKWRNDLIKSSVLNEAKIYITFDEEKLIYIGDTYKTEVTWSHFKYYIINKNSLFLLPDDNIYRSISLSNECIGQKNFERLYDIAKRKLSPL